MQAEEIASQINSGQKGLEATPWQSIFPQIADILKIWLGVQLFTVAIYYAAMALITFNTMYMAFLERMHEFAVMQAIGLTRGLLAMLILCESIVMATASGLIGTAIGACVNLVLFYYPIDLSRWMESITWGGSSIQPILFCVPSLLSNLLPLLAMILLGFAVAALPTWRLYRLKPVEALREG
jgi:ABC-type antimicrobial peptide transport system permease subunit